MVVFPIGDENPRLRTPVVHYALIAVNVVAFVYLLSLPRQLAEETVRQYGLVKSAFAWPQLLTSLFLHSGPLHLFFNMLFLWIVGDNVEDRLGHIGYLVFYLAVGVAGGAVHLVTASGQAASVPCIGASGAVSGVMAAYVAFFPNARIKLFGWFWWFIRLVYVSAKWAIGFWFVQQLLLYAFLGSSTGIAYGVHVGGFLAGLAAVLTLRGMLSPYDAVGRILGTGGETVTGWGESETMWSQPEADWSEQGGWGRAEAEPSVPVTPPPVEPVRPRTAPARPARTELAEQLTQAVNSGRTDEAMRLYERIVRYGAVTVPSTLLLKLGHVMVDHTEYDRAVRIYEDYLKRYPVGEQTAEVAFRVGMIHSRSTRDYVRARTCLMQSARDHANPRRRNRALDEIRRVDSFLRSTYVGKSRPTGLCSIIRQTDEKIVVGDVAECVAGMTGEPLADVSHRLFSTRGIVVEHVPAGKAFRLADEIQKMNVPVLVIPDRELVDVSPPEAIRQVHVSKAGVQFDVSGGGHVISTWDEVALLSVGLLQRSRKVSHTIRRLRQYHSSGRPALIQPKEEEIVTRQEGDFMVVDVFVKGQDRQRHLRGRQGEVRYGQEGSRTHHTRDRQFGAFINTILEHGPNVPTTVGAHQEASGTGGSRRDYTFGDVRAFDQYNRWQLALGEHRPQRRTSSGPSSSETT